MRQRALVGAAALVAVGLVVGVKLGVAGPGPGDPLPAPFTVRPAAGACVPSVNEEDGAKDWATIQIRPPALWAGTNGAGLVCPIDVGPGELPIQEVERARVYGFNASDREETTVQLCMFDLATGGPERCGALATATGGFASFVITAFPPDTAGLSDWTAAYLEVELAGWNGQTRSTMNGFAVQQAP